MDKTTTDTLNVENTPKFCLLLKESLPTTYNRESAKRSRDKEDNNCVIFFPLSLIRLAETWKRIRLSQVPVEVTAEVALNEKTMPQKRSGEEVYHQGMTFYRKSNYQEALPFFEKAASLKYPPAFVKLRFLYEYFGEPEKAKIAMNQCTKNAYWLIEEAGNTTPESSVATRSDTGDHQEFKKWYNKARETNSAEARCHLGHCYKTGTGVEKDFFMAAYWYQQAADMGFVTAFCDIGRCYYEGVGVAKDHAKAAYWFKRGAEQYQLRSMFNYGVLLENQGPKTHKEAFQWYKKAADMGCVYSQRNLARCYEEATGVATDLSAALYWYQKAADQGNAKAQYRLGVCHRKGILVAQDLQKAVYWFQKAAEQNIPESMFGYGRMLEEGKGVKQNYMEALMWYKKAADKGYEKAKKALKAIRDNVPEEYQQGMTFYQNKNYHKALPFFEKAASLKYPPAFIRLKIIYEAQNNTEKAKIAIHQCTECTPWFVVESEGSDVGAQYNLALYYSHISKDYEKSITLWKDLAHKGFPEAQCYLGKCYYYGTEISRDVEQAVNWFKKGAEKNHPASMFGFGMMLEKGHGIQKNLTEAALWYHKAAELGYADAQFNLGVCYENGEGVKKDLFQAVYWYRQAAEQGDPSAQSNLGCCYYFGTDVGKNRETSMYWLKKSAEQNHPQSMYNYGLVFQNEKNYREAAKWYKKAADMGCEKAQKVLAALTRKHSAKL